MKKEQWKELAKLQAFEINSLKKQVIELKEAASMSQEIGSFIVDEVSKVIGTRDETK